MYLTTKISNGDLARLSIILHRYLKFNTQDNTEGLRELDSKLQQMVVANTHSHYTIDSYGCTDSEITDKRKERIIYNQFLNWYEDGNVKTNADDTYSTQDAMYRNKITGFKNLFEYFKKEFITEADSRWQN